MVESFVHSFKRNVCFTLYGDFGSGRQMCSVNYPTIKLFKNAIDLQYLTSQITNKKNSLWGNTDNIVSIRIDSRYVLQDFQPYCSVRINTNIALRKEVINISMHVTRPAGNLAKSIQIHELFLITFTLHISAHTVITQCILRFVFEFAFLQPFTHMACENRELHMQLQTVMNRVV